MNREVMDRMCERGILALVLGLLVFGPLATGAVRTLEFLVLQGLAAGVLVLWIARLWLDPKPKLLFPPICWAVLAFSAYAVVSYFRADVEYVARQELMRVLVYAFLFLAVINNLHRQESTTIISFTLVFLAMGIAGYAIYQFATGSDYVWNFIKPYKNRGTGTYICPNHLGGFLEMILPIALAYALAGRLKPVTRVVVGYAGLVIVAGIVVSVSRGAWLSSGLALAIVFGVLALNRRYRLPALAVLGLLVIGVAVAMPRGLAFQKRAKQLVAQDGQPRDGLRYSIWEPALRMWQDNPWWGVGPAHFDVRFPGYRPDQVQYRPDRVHNDYINTLADWGIVGTTLVASAWVLLGVGVVRTWPGVRRTSEFGRNTGSNKLAFVVGACAGLAAILAHSVVDFNMHIPANAILAVTLMALVSGHIRFATEQYWVSVGLPLRAACTVALLAGLITLTVEGSRESREYIQLARAKSEPPFSAEQVTHLKRAFEVDPRNGQTAYLIGEALRRQSQEGGEHYAGLEGANYADLAKEALAWFERGIALNRWDSYNYLGAGWCLDWLKRSDEAQKYFDRAIELDPSSFHVANQAGLHYVELGNYAAARELFERSLHLDHLDNQTARSYLAIVNERLLEEAGDDLRARMRRAAREN